MVWVKLKILNKTLYILKKITVKLLFYHAKLTAEGQIHKKIDTQKSKPRTNIPEKEKKSWKDRFKNIWITDKSITAKRWKTCQECEFFIKPTSQCKKCGCVMLIKHHLATVECPVKKWGKEYDFIKNEKVNGDLNTIQD